MFLARLSQRKRAQFELRSREVFTEATEPPKPEQRPEQVGDRGRKRKRSNEDSSSTSEESADSTPPVTWPKLEKHIIVIKLEWLDACIKKGTVIPYNSRLIYAGKIISKSALKKASAVDTGIVTYIKASVNADLSSQSTPGHPPPPRPFGHARTSPTLTKRPPPRLQHGQTTADDSESRSVSPSKLPPPPEWTTSDHASYACCRSTPLLSANPAFISQLETIKLSRILTLDAIGVRAYSTSIASISAYPNPLTSETEILRLPGCNNRIAELWREWQDSASTDPERILADVRRIEADPDLKVLRLFYDIWGVGADTARKLLYTHQLKDLDDVVEYHWSQLNRVQQIGVKFYSEFQEKIPRREVEDIAATILKHARLCKGIREADFNTDNDMVCVIVGGYRRGKAASGDVDVILSHRDQEVTRDLVVDVVRSLETEGWITHTLTLQTTTSDRDQQTLPFRGEGHGGHGFDSLDKALCVWQDPVWDDRGGEETRNTNVHRRVDIILSPWRTVGCAVLGWSGGTTFQRDIRRFAAKMKGWKFDSSGVRDRGTGVVVDLEGNGGTWEERERRVMEGLGIGYRPATERCTG